MQEFSSPFWLPNGHAQTIWPSVFGSKILRKKVKPIFKRQTWFSPDGDFIDIDSQRSFQCSRQPLVVLFHGLEGSSGSFYSTAFYHMCTKLNFSLSIPHFRGCSGRPNRKLRGYHAGDIDEIDWILEKYSQLCSIEKIPLYAVGISLGGNALLHWAGSTDLSQQKFLPLKAIAAVCAPANLKASTMAIDSSINRIIYANYFLKSMKKKAVQKWKQYPNNFSLDKILAAKTLKEFDNNYTAPLHDFKDVNEYWEKCSSDKVIEKIKIRTLVIYSQNDPIVPFETLPLKKIESNPEIQFYVLSSGGHVNFLRKSNTDFYSLDYFFLQNTILTWFNTNSI